MSDPAGDPPLPAPAGKPPNPARWLDRVSVALVIAGVAGAIGAASPSLLRALGVIEPPAPVIMAPVRPPTAHLPPPPPAPQGTTYAFDDHPRFAPDDDPPHITDLERLYPDGMWPGQRPDRHDLPPPATQPKDGFAQSPLTVRDKADVAANVTGRVPAGAPVRILLEKGAWALIAYRTDDGAVVGWTARSGILLP
jgi:hypothetical protein